MMSKKHLDLGCGLKPRNPYHAELTFGCDIRDIDAGVKDIGFDYKKVNLVLEPIPYPDNYFDSVSAFDFFEHVPRQVVLSNGESSNPFINLMNEIHRVLVPGGRLLALTPAYQHVAAFSDPTHVNFITADTHEYFTGSQPTGAMYGFKGAFDVIQVRWEASSNAYNLNQPEWRKSLRRLHRRVAHGGLSHLIWELAANKG
jgi:SAM-dependent methyltransferase